jgi:hypothetical protein
LTQACTVSSRHPTSESGPDMDTHYPALAQYQNQLKTSEFFPYNIITNYVTLKVAN